METPNYSALLNELLDGTITEGGRRQLQTQLGRDPDLRREYYDLRLLDHLLAERCELPVHLSGEIPAFNPSRTHPRIRTSRILKLAVVVVSGVAATVLLFSRIDALPPGPVSLEASVGCRYRVDGSRGRAVIEVGRTLEIERGVVAMDLNAHTKVHAEGPVRLRLRDRRGNVELLQGKAYFEVIPGGRGFEVHCPAGVIRHVGTRFGVEVKVNGFVETRVMEGRVEITDATGGVRRVDAGRAVGWNKSGGFSVMTDTARFVQTLPQPRVILSDDFDEPDGTPLDQKPADIGGRWSDRKDLHAEPGRARINVARGMIDTSYGYRAISAPCRLTGMRDPLDCYFMTFTTAVPANMADKGSMPQAEEKIVLVDADGIPRLSLVGRAAGSHRWVILDEVSGKESPATPVSALEKSQLTLFYESDTGQARLHQGTSADAPGRELATLAATPGVTAASVMIANVDGGDLAIDDILIGIYNNSSETSRPD